MEMHGANKLFGRLRGDIDRDVGLVRADILSAFLALAHVKHWFFKSTSLAARRFYDDDREVGASTGD